MLEKIKLIIVGKITIAGLKWAAKRTDSKIDDNLVALAEKLFK